ncbi:hypothetical protein LTR70_003068 [Exophiala xenobiotica]|uniref:Vacuolar protein sorting-associated protein 54 C-terminal domain-containing protein n=1 Tax=Lithohypha guttulata TaxID=1690604 RepID=A0ABR0KH95_9EURO|nr:hypothetical protein LTR24_002699 [Lithohypha guttulata]KAK5323779.1 hypothetical protein LTR70_003068 [Exophiala xenobiotica]
MNTPGMRSSSDVLNSPLTPSLLSQYPFPIQDGPIRRGPLRRGSTTSSVSSLAPSIAESHPNAISTLLQPPIIRTGLRPVDAGFKPPTQKDIPPVTLTNIPHVEPKAFHPYLSQVGSLYEAFQRAKNEIDGDDTALFHREKKDKGDDWDAILSKKLQRPAHSRAGSVTSVTSPIDPSTQPKRRSSQQKRHAVTPLSTIPTVYGEEDFHLENPRTFDIVSEHSEIVRDPNAAPSGRKSLATNAILQEKLSWYMDTVEVHLISSISTASKSFFSALGSLRELHDEAEESVVRIQRLRRDLAKLDKDMAMDGLKVVKLKQRRDNVRRLAEAMLQLEDVVNAVRDCEEMVENGQIDGAMDDVDDIERLIAGYETKKLFRSRSQERYQAMDLRRIRALEGSLNDLGQLRFHVGRGYETRFHNCLLNDMRQHVKNADPKLTLQRWGAAFNRPKPGQRRAPSAFPSYMNMSADFRTELERAMQGLTRAKYTTPAVTSFRAAVMREMKAMIRRQLPTSDEDDNVSTISGSTQGGRGRSQQEKKSSILARNIRAMDDGDWYNMLQSVYTNVSECLRRLSVQVKILLDVTSTMDQSQADGLKSPPAMNTPGHIRAPSVTRPRAQSIQAEMQQALDLSSLLGEAVDAVQSQVTKVIRVRSQANTEMPTQDFIRFVTLNRLFADECEAISGRSGQDLKSVLDSQIRTYISDYGRRQPQSLVDIMDNDKWEAKDFGDAENTLLSRVIDGSTIDVQKWLESTQIWQAQSPEPPTFNRNNTNGEGGDSKEKVRLATVDEQRYILPASPIALLRTVESVEMITVGMPGMGQELAQVLLDCLRQFNSRTLQLILGAGATRTAGLKNITTKHLALSSQSLSFVIALMPYIREFFRRYLPQNNANQTMQEFDKVKRSFQEHQNSIHDKLVDIMSGRATMHVKSLKAINWAEAARDDSEGVSKYMETLTKETATLQKVLAKHLGEGVVMSIMGPVFDSYKQQLEKAFSESEVRSDAEKSRMINDAAHFNSKISKLEGSGNLGEKILDLVKTKTIRATTANGSSDAKAEGIEREPATSNEGTKKG